MINVCLIGTGRAGMIHGRNIQFSLKDARLIALCDPSKDALSSAQEELQVDYLYTDYLEALDNPEIDAVVVVTPTKFHKEIVVAAAKKGKHILCEKPLAMNAKECDEMIAACKKNNVKLQVGFMRRFDESFRQAKAIVESGDIGDVVLVKSLSRGPSHPKPWMFDISISNGPIGEVNSHDFDTLRWFTGSELNHIYAVGGNFRSPQVKEEYPDFYDTVSMNMVFENDVLGAIDGGQYVQYGYDARVEIVGTHGCIMLGDQQKHTVVTAQKDGRLIRSAMHSWTYLFREAYVQEDKAFIEAILKDTEPLVTGYDGKMAVQMVKTGLTSYLEKRVVYFSECQ